MCSVPITHPTPASLVRYRGHFVCFEKGALYIYRSRLIPTWATGNPPSPRGPGTPEHAPHPLWRPLWNTDRIQFVCACLTQSRSGEGCYIYLCSEKTNSLVSMETVMHMKRENTLAIQVNSPNHRCFMQQVRPITLDLRCSLRRRSAQNNQNKRLVPAVLKLNINLLPCPSCCYLLATITGISDKSTPNCWLSCCMLSL